LNNRGQLFVLSGSSGGGKTTIIHEVLSIRKDFVFSVSSTTREPREHEKEGVDYHFLKRDEFLKRRDAGEFIEWAEVHKHLYGTEHRQIDKMLELGQNVILDLDVYGASSIHDLFPNAVLIFIFPPSVEELRRRLENRGTNTPEQIELRLSRYPFERARGEAYPYHVLNDNLMDTVDSVLEIIEDVISSRAKRSI